MKDGSDTGVCLVRVEAGTADTHELAALTAVLLMRMAGARPSDPAGKRPAVARWRGRSGAAGFDGPRTWRRT